jgi:hypothetical protein
MPIIIRRYVTLISLQNCKVVIASGFNNSLRTFTCQICFVAGVGDSQEYSVNNFLRTNFIGEARLPQNIGALVHDLLLRTPAAMSDYSRLKQARDLTVKLLRAFKDSGFTEKAYRYLQCANHRHSKALQTINFITFGPGLSTTCAQSLKTLTSRQTVQ